MKKETAPAGRAVGSAPRRVGGGEEWARRRGCARLVAPPWWPLPTRPRPSRDGRGNRLGSRRATRVARRASPRSSARRAVHRGAAGLRGSKRPARRRARRGGGVCRSLAAPDPDGIRTRYSFVCNEVLCQDELLVPKGMVKVSSLLGLMMGFEPTSSRNASFGRSVHAELHQPPGRLEPVEERPAAGPRARPRPARRGWRRQRPRRYAGARCSGCLKPNLLVPSKKTPRTRWASGASCVWVAHKGHHRGGRW